MWALELRVATGDSTAELTAKERMQRYSTAVAAAKQSIRDVESDAAFCC